MCVLTHDAERKFHFHGVLMGLNPLRVVRSAHGKFDGPHHLHLVERYYFRVLPCLRVYSKSKYRTVLSPVLFIFPVHSKSRSIEPCYHWLCSFHCAWQSDKPLFLCGIFSPTDEATPTQQSPSNKISIRRRAAENGAG